MGIIKNTEEPEFSFSEIYLARQLQATVPESGSIPKHLLLEPFAEVQCKARMLVWKMLEGGYLVEVGRGSYVGRGMALP